MKRSLIYIAIFAIFFWTTWATEAYLISPTYSTGQQNLFAIISFFALFCVGLTFTLALFIAAAKTKLPNPKLPHLLLQDSFIQAGLASAWVTGLLVLQLLRSLTVLHFALWLIIILGIEWLLYETRKQ
jgi:hypothetical protein